METAWLLDDGTLCLGASRLGLTMCPYFDRRALRFAREEDAENMRYALKAIGMPLTARHVAPVEHAWDPGVPQTYDA